MNNFANFLKKFFINNKQSIMYLIFGVVTTVVNVVVYYISYNLLSIPNVISTIIAWIVAVIIAYFTNKLWVFESKSFALSVVLKEFISFFSCRFLTGAMDVGIMWFGVDFLSFNSTIIKILANIIVIIANYTVSKLFIFNKKSNH